jgi:hypothetical protein
MFEDADLIHSYTRTDALRDGVLIDVSAVAREAGIRYPVALTRAVWGYSLPAAMRAARPSACLQWLQRPKPLHSQLRRSPSRLTW